VLKLTINVQTQLRSPLPDSLEVEIIVVTLRSRKTAARLKRVDGDWQPSTIDIAGPENLQAVLRVSGSDLEYGRSAILTNVRGEAHFNITYVDLTPKQPLYNRLHTALAEVAAMPAPATDELTLVLAAANEDSTSVARYFQARTIGLEMGRLASAEAKANYANYLQSPDNAKLAQSKIDILQALVDRQALLPEMAFALLASGDTSALQLIKLTSEEVTSRLKQSIANGQVQDWSRQRGNSIETWAERLIVLRDGLNLSLSDRADRKAQMIVLADIPLSKASALFDHALLTGGLANPEKAGLTADETFWLDLVQRLMKICDDDIKLAATFMAQQTGAATPTDMKPAQRRSLKPDTFIQAMVATPVAEWEKIATRAVAAQTAPGNTARVKLSAEQMEAAKATASRIAAKLLIAEPRAALVAQVSAPSAKKFAAAGELLKKHADFDPARQSAESYFRDEKAVAPEQIENLKTFQRLVKISPEGHKRVEVASALVSAGYTSASQIVQGGKIDFLATMENAVSIEEARAIYCRAREIADLRAELEIRLQHSGVRTYADWTKTKDLMLAEAIDLNAGVDNAPVTPPSLAEMFGSFDACACSDCQSVHSPASYLHNLLYWMKSDVAGAWGILEARRPDIKHLQLSCANTHTTLPYIDIVNEFLCSRIVSGIAPPAKTAWKEPALRLQPEYRYPTAETKLTQQYFPLTLPFDRPRAEGETALRAVDMPVDQVMEIFMPGDHSTWSLTQKNAHVASRLELSSWAADFVTWTTVPSSFWSQYTGINPVPTSLPFFITSVGIAMTTLGVEYQKLLSLLSLDFVRRDEDRNVVFSYESIKFADEKCAYENASFVADTALPGKNKISDMVVLSALQIMRLAQATGFDEVRINALLLRFVEIYKTDPSNATVSTSNPIGTSKLVMSQDFLNFLERLKTIEEMTGVSIEASCALIEAIFPNGTGGFDAPASINMFVDLYKLRSSADVVRYVKLFGDGVTPTASRASTLALRIERLKMLFGIVVDTANIPVWIPPLSTIYVKQVLLAIKAKLFSSGGSAVATDRVHLQKLILDAVSETLGIDQALAQQIYVARSDTWFDACDVADVSGYPVTILALGPYVLALWDAAMHQWLANAILCCGCSAPLSDAIKAVVEPSGGLPDYSKLNQSFVLRLAQLRTLARNYGLREELLVPALFDSFTPSLLTLALPHLAPGWTAVIGTAPIVQDQLDTLEHALRLNRLSTLTGESVTYFASTFNNPASPTWEDASALPEVHDKAAQLTKSIAATRSAETRVMTVLQDGMDDVRKSFRDALVDCLLWQQQSLKNMEGIYKHLLLDPAMQPCMLTSRLVLATSSVQLLMHRALLNLEPGIAPDADDREEFEWRKNYQVWAANVKVLLYPENWIEPELRLDPTPLFEEAMASLSQDEVTQEHCEKILYDYLSGLDKIARLDIRAFYRDERTNPDTLHVFGRSWNAPYEYFYRRRTEEHAWTAWEKIDIDIEGDHLIPVIFHDRLWLFWPIFVEKEHRDIKVNVNGEMRGAPYLEIRMAYTTYEHGRWRGKKLLGSVLEVGSYYGPEAALNLPIKIKAEDGGLFSDVMSNHFFDFEKLSLNRAAFFFWAAKDSEENLVINLRRRYASDYVPSGYSDFAYEDGFKIAVCGGAGHLVPAMPQSSEVGQRGFIARPLKTQPDAQNMVSGFNRFDLSYNAGQANSFALYAKNENLPVGGSFPILSKVPGDFQLSYPQKKDAMWSEPFFMADSHRTHFFERRTVCKMVGTEHLDIQDERYDVSLHQHPYACLLISSFNRWGIEGLFPARGANNPVLRQAKSEPLYFKTDYDPGTLNRINLPLPVEDFDFNYGGAYAAYNWELFFHLPTLIARQLKTEGRHKEAIRWLRLVFDPTSREPLGIRRVWGLKPFMTASTQTSIATMIKLLSQGGTDPAQEKMRAAVAAQIKAWRDHPFEPHKIAESRLSAYMLWCVLEYIDVLIEWGDELFRQDSMESINEATNLYLLAKEILGERPTVVDKGSRTEAKSFAELNPYTGFSWSADVEAHLAGYDVANDCRSTNEKCRPPVAASLFPGQYFCIAPNPKLPEYWDRVEDRLFKIRHCRNLDGEQRSLALFQPPIDPALLVRARAAGLSIEDVLAGLAEAQMPYRFQYLLGKAQDFTAEVKALGGQLLSAMEKKDAEELSQIRQTHELNIQRATHNLKLMSLAEAKEGLAALNHSLKGIEITLANYEGREFMNPNEQNAYALTNKADEKIEAEHTTQYVASVLRIIPQIIASVPPGVETGGAAIGGVAELVAATFGMQASTLRSKAGRASTLGSYDRRGEEWRLQIETSRERIKEVSRQIVSAEIRIQTAEKDLEVFDLQVEQSKEVYDYMRSKFTNEQLYGWMVGQLKTFHRGAYNLAANMARQAQMAYKRELGDGTPAGTPPDELTANHWDSSRAGLLAGEKLSFELKKLDDAYVRARAKLTIYELSRTVSLRRLDPGQLYELRSGKAIAVMLPDWLFQTKHADRELKDMRIKTVSISLPCTVGPNTRVPLEVRLINPFGPAQQKIVTSTSQGDSGRFDPHPNGETYLPFENEKIADSQWQITLPKLREFDPATISDLIFNIRYTAQPNTDAATPSPVQSNLEAGKGRFAVSLRYDNHDSWLQLQRDLKMTPSAVKPLSAYFPIDIVRASTPYVYSSSTENAYYLIYETTEAFDLLFSDPALALNSTNEDLSFSPNSSSIVNSGRIVVDIVQIREGTVSG
jgi:hypothetical protein